MRPPAPALMLIADLLQSIFLATKEISSELALPSTGRDFPMLLELTDTTVF
jgi:hypothetical protein